MEKINNFISKYLPFAVDAENATGVPAVFILAQAALESDWGLKAIGNNVFGIKYNPKLGHKFQEVLTTEYFSTKEKALAAIPDEKVVSIEWIPERSRFKVKAHLLFADYDSPADAFMSHAKLLTNKRYGGALEFKNNLSKFAEHVANAGYSTSQNYAQTLKSVIHSIERRLV